MKVKYIGSNTRSIYLKRGEVYEVYSELEKEYSIYTEDMPHPHEYSKSQFEIVSEDAGKEASCM